MTSLAPKNSGGSEGEVHRSQLRGEITNKKLGELAAKPLSTGIGIRKVERREWWLWSSAVIVTLLLTLGIASFLLPLLHRRDFELLGLHLPSVIRGLVAIVLLFDLHVIYQQVQIHRIRRLLAEREELFCLITENAADMIAVVDVDGRFLYISPAYERILGYASAELRQMSVLDQIHPEDQTLLLDTTRGTRVLASGRRVEYRFRHREGHWCTLESTTSAVLSGNGTVQRFVIVNRDITARKRLEEQFRQAQKMEAVGRLSGGDRTRFQQHSRRHYRLR